MLTAYPGIGRKKGWTILEAFAAGCDGTVQPPGTAKLLPPGVTPAFYGSHVGDTEPLLEQAKAERREWWYLDNSYCIGFGQFFRITRCALQHHGKGVADGARWRAFGIEIAPWQRDGRHVVIASQSDGWHLRHDGVNAAEWARLMERGLRGLTDRPIQTVSKPHPNARGALAEALRGAWTLVVRDSTAAVQALLVGVPAICLRPCAASCMTEQQIELIEKPFYPDDRLRWMQVLCSNQFTLPEMRSGFAWRALHAA